MKHFNDKIEEFFHQKLNEQNQSDWDDWDRPSTDAIENVVAEMQAGKTSGSLKTKWLKYFGIGTLVFLLLGGNIYQYINNKTNNNTAKAAQQFNNTAASNLDAVNLLKDEKVLENNTVVENQITSNQENSSKAIIEDNLDGATVAKSTEKSILKNSGHSSTNSRLKQNKSNNSALVNSNVQSLTTELQSNENVLNTRSRSSQKAIKTNKAVNTPTYYQNKVNENISYYRPSSDKIKLYDPEKTYKVFGYNEIESSQINKNTSNKELESAASPVNPNSNLSLNTSSVVGTLDFIKASQVNIKPVDFQFNITDEIKALPKLKLNRRLEIGIAAGLFRFPEIKQVNNALDLQGNKQSESLNRNLAINKGLFLQYPLLRNLKLQTGIYHTQYKDQRSFTYMEIYNADNSAYIGQESTAQAFVFDQNSAFNDIRNHVLLELANDSLLNNGSPIDIKSDETLVWNHFQAPLGLAYESSKQGIGFSIQSGLQYNYIRFGSYTVNYKANSNFDDAFTREINVSQDSFINKNFFTAYAGAGLHYNFENKLSPFVLFNTHLMLNNQYEQTISNPSTDFKFGIRYKL